MCCVGGASCSGGVNTCRFCSDPTGAKLTDYVSTSGIKVDLSPVIHKTQHTKITRLNTNAHRRDHVCFTVFFMSCLVSFSNSLLKVLTNEETRGFLWFERCWDDVRTGAVLMKKSSILYLLKRKIKLDKLLIQQIISMMCLKHLHQL